MKQIFSKLKKRVYLSDQRQAFFNHQLIVYGKYIGIATLAMGIINIMLLIPDIILIDSVLKKLVIIIFRIVFSGMLLLLSLKYKKIKNTTYYFRIITCFEILAIVEFLFVFNLYSQPNYIIQAMGMLTINIIIFFIPNRLINMFCVSILGTLAFFINSLLVIIPMDYEGLLASIVYIVISIFLCSLFAIEIDKHQFNEFVIKNELIYSSLTDPLTRAWNRNKIYDEFNALKDYHYNRNMTLSLVLIDIDNFKAINDTNGHCVADAALVEIVKLINLHLRSTDMLIRWGGDEFILLLADTDLSAAIIILEKIRKAIVESDFVNLIKITCSFGVVESKDNMDLDTMIDQADKLMYEAKKLGGNHVVYNS